MKSAPKDGSSILVRRRPKDVKPAIKHWEIRIAWRRDHWVNQTVAGSYFRDINVSKEFVGWKPM